MSPKSDPRIGFICIFALYIKIMPKARFTLKEPDSSKPTLIYLFFSFDNQRLKYSTGEKIIPAFWNPLKQRAREKSSFPSALEFNQRLTNIETAVENCYRKLLNDNQNRNEEDIKPITPDLLREELTSVLNGKNKVKSIELIEWMEKELENLKISKKQETYRGLSHFVTFLKKFSELKKYKITFESINLEFYEKFKEYHFVDNNYLTNTFGSRIKILKSFLNLATEKGVNKNLLFRSRSFKSAEETLDSVYLTDQELEQIYNLDLSGRPCLDDTRNLFLIGCHTGLRFSDFSQLKPANLQKIGDKLVFNLKTKKTNEKVVIPVKTIVKTIWDKYEGNLPKAISNQTTNQNLKVICKLAGIDQEVIIKKTSGINVQEFTGPKYNFVTSHTARRSFATNAFLNNIPAISIMKFTGHKTEISFMKYIKVSQERNAQLLSDHPFFK